MYHLEILSPFQDILTKTAFISPPVEAGVFCGDRIKLTLTDSARSGFSASTETYVASPGGTLDVSYSEVTTGDYVSALLCDASGEILYYASKTPEASGEGTWSMTIPARLAKGSYTFKVFSE